MIISDLTYLEAASEVTGIVGGKNRRRVNRSILARQQANISQTNTAIGGDSVVGVGGPAIVALNFATSQPDQIVSNSAAN